MTYKNNGEPVWSQQMNEEDSSTMKSVISDPSGSYQAEASVRLHIRTMISDAASDKRVEVGDSPFEPQSAMVQATQPVGDYTRHYVGVKGSNTMTSAPEKKITLFALRLAILEKAASGLGTLAFIWATVVLLGGFAITLEKADFWFVTVILLIEGTRIFSRSRELEWQHETTLSVAHLTNDARLASSRLFNATRSFLKATLRQFSASNIDYGEGNIDPGPPQNSKESNDHHTLKRSWSCSDVQLLPYTGWLSVSKNVSRLLFWSQLLSASTCVAMSLYRLSGQDYGVVSDSKRKNRGSALNIFYCLSLAEALLFLLEKAYWQWKIIAGKLLVEVNQEYGFDAENVHTVRRFFYDAYSCCVNSSVFEGLRMDMVSFSIDLLQSSSDHSQLTGAKVLSVLVRDPRFQHEALRSVGTMKDVVERLVEMLNWKNRHEQEIRKAAAEIISSLVKMNRNSLRVARIPGALESITSLLHDAKAQQTRYDYSGFSLLGLRILKHLAKDHDNCSKIGGSKNLLPKIIEFIHIERNVSDFETRIRTAKQSLQLLKLLASSKGVTGKVLRKEIMEIVFTISNLRDALLYRGFDHVRLQILAIETLTSLALEEEGRESIGSTGGVLHDLFCVFFVGRIDDDGEYNDDERQELVAKSGRVLTLLALENSHNCRSMIKIKLTKEGSKHEHVIADLIAVLTDPVQGVHATRILRSLCDYAETDYDELREITVAAEQVVKLVMEEQGRFLEAAIGLAAQMFKFLSSWEMDKVMKDATLTKRMFLLRIIEVLGKHPRPSTRVPSTRRFCIELVISMLQKDREFFLMEISDVEVALQRVMETTSDMESYSTFSGSIGLTKHRISIHSLVQNAMELLRD